MNSKLLGTAGLMAGATFYLPVGEASIGREPSNQFCVADPALSRRHCLLIRADKHVFIRDLASRNGTLLNGVPLEQQQQLRDGDQICVGNSVFLFLQEEGEELLNRNPVEFAQTAKIYPSRSAAVPIDSLPDQANDGHTDRSVTELNALLKLATNIGGIPDQESLQWQLLGFIFDVVPAERGAMLLCDSAHGFSSEVAWDRVLGPGHPVRVSTAVVQRVLQERAGIVVSQMTGKEDPAGMDLHSELQVSSVLCVPLLTGKKALGAIYLDSSDPQSRFDKSHLQVMTAVAGIASLAFEKVRRLEQMREENQHLRAEIILEHNMVGGSRRMREVFEFIRRVAPTDSTVLIQGESGTGKELVARAIHRHSIRVQRPFVAINCAAITPSLLESELFGHEKGAFTGASGQKKGKVEMAEGGTLFLDEVSELASDLQAKLLRVLQEREFERVGGTRPIKLDVRLIAATNRSLSEAVKAGSFRNDLYYRLNVVAVTMPALRDRREDISLLADHFVAKTSRKCKVRAKSLSAEARACLTSYDWPGNVRELENAIERALVLGSTDTIIPDDLPEAILETSGQSASVIAKYHGAIKDAKRQLVAQALEQAHGNYIEASKALQIHPNSLLRLIRNLDLKAASKV